MTDSSPTETCVHCGYALHGLTQTRYCPECGRPPGVSDPKHFALEERILERADRYRRNYVGCMFLGGLSAMGVCMYAALLSNPIVTSNRDVSFLSVSVAHAAFWFALAFAFKARMAHARTLELRKGSTSAQAGPAPHEA